MINDAGRAHGQFYVEAFDSQGQLKWAESFSNTVVNVGLQNMVGATLTGATRYTTWYLGLINGPVSGVTINGADTMSSHTGWTENTSYAEAARVTATLSSPTSANPSVTSNSAAAAIFTINATVTLAGVFLSSDSTKGGTSGLLFSAATFSPSGDRTLYNSDILRITYTYSLSRT